MGKIRSSGKTQRDNGSGSILMVVTLHLEALGFGAVYRARDKGQHEVWQ
jgi:hypothetical protein